MVDRLLASPHYGERWGRHWLDVARYADTKGYVLFQDANFPGPTPTATTWSRPSTTTCPTTVSRRADRGRPAAAPGGQPAAGGAGLPHPRRPVHGQRPRHDRRPDRRRLTAGLHGPDRRLRPLPRPQVRPDPDGDYYSLYGVLASARRAGDPPEADEPRTTARIRQFVKELDGAQQKLSEFVATKHRELVEACEAAGRGIPPGRAAGARSADHRRIHAARRRQRPEPGDAGAVAGLPVADRKRHDPVFAPWHALAALPEADFAARCAVIAGSRRGGRGRPCPTNQSGRRPGPGRQSPRSLAEAARDLRRLLNGRAALARAGRPRRRSTDGRPAAARAGVGVAASGVPRPGQPARGRRWTRSATWPCCPTVPRRPSFRSCGTPSQNWLTSGPGAPPRAMSLEDSPEPVEPRVFLRGNPNNLGERVPRRFLAVLSGPSGSRSATAAAGSSWRGPSRPRQPADGPRPGQPRLDAPLRHAPRRDAGRFRPAERAAHAPRAARPPGRALHGRRLVDQGTPSPDHALGAYQQRSDDRPEARALDPENASTGG